MAIRAAVAWVAVLCLVPACSRESAPPVTPDTATDAAATAEVAVADGLADSWRAVRHRLDALEADPESPAAQAAFLSVLHEVCASPDLDLHLTPDETTLFGGALQRAHAFALEGRSDFLEVLMYVSVGPYGSTGEGGEWLNELLWEVLERRPRATLAALAENGDIRGELVDSIYTRPVDDSFDFDAVVTGLRSLEVPEEWAHLEADVRRIVEAAEAFAGAPSVPEARREPGVGLGQAPPLH